ncbi:toxin-antitoxin system YwqK family antitoxin [Ferruginibacter profundus]
MEHQARLHFKAALLFFCIAVTGCTAVTEQQPQPVSLLLLNTTDTGIKNKNGIIYFNQQVFSGVLYSLYPATTDTATKASYLNGKEHGIWVKYYPGGKLQEQREFNNGRKTGTLFTWWPSGHKQMYCLLKDDEYEGVSREWTDSGVLVKEMNYHKGQEEGSQRWWYDNGKVRANYIIIRGRRYGLLGTKHCTNVSDSIFKN